ncbi:MAG: flagellar hook-basal body complex protein [Desulfurivibrio sp.]|nr:flagellar hook-basal body complex protein [Desulfurivibrio sp.]
MSLHNMIFNGVSGINSMSGNMAVMGDNIANVNTTSYKSSHTTFQNVLTSSLGFSNEAGNGSRLGAITRNFRPGELETTTQSTDMAVSGKGFFMLNDPLNEEMLYTRDGQFKLEKAATTPEGFYNLATPAGHMVQGQNLLANEGAENLGDILVQDVADPQATSSVSLALNLENKPGSEEAQPLHASWNGAADEPLAADRYDYRTIMQAFDDQGQEFDLSVYFDRTAQDNEREFLVTHDPTLDRRLKDDGESRYNDGQQPETGAGALLYGKLNFSNTGELLDIGAWDVSPDGTLEPTEDSESGLPSFKFNLSGQGDNLSSTIDFGTTVSTRTVHGGGGAKADRSGESNADALTTWDQVYDPQGRQVQEGDQYLQRDR